MPNTPPANGGDDQSKWHVSNAELAATGVAESRWNEMSSNEKIVHATKKTLKVLLLLFFIFGFICTLSLLGVAFKLIGGKGLGSAIKHSGFLHNPIAASIVGMVISMALQNTTTFMSVLVSMVAGRLLTVHEAIPFMIGTEIGGSVLNVLVSMAQSGDRDQFRRAFAAATMNDVFNLLNYIVILPLEITTGLIERTSGFLVRPLSHARNARLRTLEAITTPLLQLVIQIDSDAITRVAAQAGNATAVALLDRPTFIRRCVNVTTGAEIPDCPYAHLFAYSAWSDVVIGVLLLVVSIGTLLGCLIGIIRVMKSLLAGSLAVFVRKMMDYNCPFPFRFLTGYLIMLIGALIVGIVSDSTKLLSTFLLFDSIGERLPLDVDPVGRPGDRSVGPPLLAVRANIGTTSTATLSALSSDPSQLQETMQMALCQTLYNCLGMLLFYPIPFMRQIPISIAMKLGNTTAKHRWFSICYTVVVFVLMPAFLVGLSLLPELVMFSVLAVSCTFIVLVIGINWLQSSYPKVLPERLRSWSFLPAWLHSLSPYDPAMQWLGEKLPCCPRRFFAAAPTAESNDSISLSTLDKPTA
ncbi:hypothetical protein M3Y99_01253400 [Aphelenchoides fujianensis]|nr:hypothetical protein M3Y99_01253400 [Aphelenchoides fujianensis]